MTASEPCWNCEGQNLPTCWNCQNLFSWFYPGSREEPPDSGYECSLGLDDTPDVEAFYELPEEDAVKAIAAQCPKYERQTTED